MYLRLSIVFTDESLKTVDLNIDHIVYCGKDNTLSIYDRDLAIYDISLDWIYYFANIIPSEAGVDYKCYNNLDLAFADIGLKEVDEFNL